MCVHAILLSIWLLFLCNRCGWVLDLFCSIEEAMFNLMGGIWCAASEVVFSTSLVTAYIMHSGSALWISCNWWYWFCSLWLIGFVDGLTKIILVGFHQHAILMVYNLKSISEWTCCIPLLYLVICCFWALFSKNLNYSLSGKLYLFIVELVDWSGYLLFLAQISVVQQTLIQWDSSDGMFNI
jgi:hypothetical protein